MVILTDNQTDSRLIPTGRNMLAAFHWLVSNNYQGDSLFLHYSGHGERSSLRRSWLADISTGGQVKDPDGDRENGFDDTICPVDFEQYGQITSDTLHRVIVTPLAPGVRLTVIFDCCHCEFRPSFTALWFTRA